MKTFFTFVQASVGTLASRMWLSSLSPTLDAKQYIILLVPCSQARKSLCVVSVRHHFLLQHNSNTHVRAYTGALIWPRCVVASVELLRRKQASHSSAHILLLCTRSGIRFVCVKMCLGRRGFSTFAFWYYVKDNMQKLKQTELAPPDNIREHRESMEYTCHSGWERERESKTTKIWIQNNGTLFIFHTMCSVRTFIQVHKRMVRSTDKYFNAHKEHLTLTLYVLVLV